MIMKILIWLGLRCECGGKYEFDGYKHDRCVKCNKKQ